MEGILMNATLIKSLVISLVLTIIFEITFFFVLGKRNKKDLLLVILVNVITNPVVVLLFWLAALYTDWNRTLVYIPLELFAVLTEGYYYKKYGMEFKRPFLFSLAANAVSFGAGLLLQLVM